MSSLSMKSLSLILSSSPPQRLQNHRKALKTTTSTTTTTNTNLSILNAPSLSTLSISTLLTSIPLPCLASETLTLSETQNKIDLESILISIDDFFNKNPFFVAGCTFIWLFVIPVTRTYFRKWKFISAIDGFRKLKENEEVQLLDIRESKSLKALESPDLMALNKNVAQVDFLSGDEDGFVKNVLNKFPDPGNTVLCIMDNFDGNSLRAAELLFKNGFKEAYAIRGGVRGKKGWLEIQETLLPRAVHMYPKTKKKKNSRLTNGGVVQQDKQKADTPLSMELSKGESQKGDNGNVYSSSDTTSHVQTTCHSPYPNYPDFKPPASPTPSKP